MRVIRPPEEFEGSTPSIFMAGGISGCPTWQDAVIEQLTDTPMLLVNPRRLEWPDDPAMVEKQIAWEHRHLRRATGILFWFPRETLCPITLYELGCWSMTEKPMVVGVHPEYPRALDVRVQTRLARPDVPLVHTLDELATLVRTLWGRWEHIGGT